MFVNTSEKAELLYNSEKKQKAVMDSKIAASCTKITMSAKTFDNFSVFIQDELGIKMGINKKVMLQARLMKRLRALKMSSYDEYYDYLFGPAGQKNELSFFVHQVTTNKTEFFREPAHYKYFSEQAIPTLMSQNKYSFRRPLRVWSSACSTGEEPYTLALVLSEFAELQKEIDFTILATDISPTVLENASYGVYEESKIGPIPFQMRKKYLLRSKDKKKKLVRIVPELRSKVDYQWVNLKKPPYDITDKMDIIFCRNVIIYFNRSTQENVLRHLSNQLLPGGYIFMGHSETLAGFDLPLNQVAPTIYKKNEF